jgi:uroporphyrinogen decarboxylase
MGMAVSDVFPLDPKALIGLDTGPLPSFVPRGLGEDERWRTSIDQYGFTVRTLKEQSVAPVIYYYLDGVVHDRRDWETLKSRYDPADPRRKPRTWGPELIDYYNGATCPVGLRIDWGPGRGAKNGYAMGLERFMEVLIDDPGLVKDMFDFWADFVIEVASDLVTQCQIDFVYLSEDGMAYKNGTLVSPQMYRDLWIPGMRRVTDFLHAHGIDVIGHYSSGNQIPLIPVLLDIGVNLYAPLEVAAGMDAQVLRKRFGKDILLLGNISRQALMDGPEAVEREFYAKVPPMMAVGGYIPAVDDMILPDISFQSYKRYIDLVRGYRL